MGAFSVTYVCLSNDMQRGMKHVEDLEKDVCEVWKNVACRNVVKAQLWFITLFNWPTFL